MAEITAAMVKELRERTGAGMMDCKNALREANGDMALAAEVLAKKGLSKVSKAAGKIAAASRHAPFGEIDASDVAKLLGQLPVYARAGARFLCSGVFEANVFGRLKLAAGGNSVQTLSGAVLEQFPIASVKDLAKRQVLATEGIARIASRQNYDGGFRYWDTRERSWPYLSTWATFALLEGKKAGFKVDQAVLDKAMNYLENFVQNGESTPWGRYYDHTSRTFALWLLSREDRGSELFDRVWAKRDEVPLYARAQLMSAAHKYGRASEREALLKDFRARVTENARTAHFAERTSEAEADGLQLLMHSDVQTDAVTLMAMLEIAEADPLLPKVMAGIMDSRDPQRGGRWDTTHANA